MNTLQKMGVGLSILGIAMFLVAAHLFTYQGEELDPIFIDIGEISISLWLPTIIVGILLIPLGKLFKQ
ncbi:MAG: hypothetical protein ACRCVT_08190 [Leadbetterella sp.]